MNAPAYPRGAGRAWDHAKKFIEMGAYGGKGTVPHKPAWLVIRQRHGWARTLCADQRC